MILLRSRLGCVDERTGCEQPGHESKRRFLSASPSRGRCERILAIPIGHELPEQVARRRCIVADVIARQAEGELKARRLPHAFEVFVARIERPVEAPRLIDRPGYAMNRIAIEVDRPADVGQSVIEEQHLSARQGRDVIGHTRLPQRVFGNLPQRGTELVDLSRPNEEPLCPAPPVIKRIGRRIAIDEVAREIPVQGVLPEPVRCVQTELALDDMPRAARNVLPADGSHGPIQSRYFVHFRYCLCSLQSREAARHRWAQPPRADGHLRGPNVVAAHRQRRRRCESKSWKFGTSAAEPCRHRPPILAGFHRSRLGSTPPRQSATAETVI